MKLFIGDKKEFGIELFIHCQEKPGIYLGNGKLWFGNVFIGTIEEQIYLNGYLAKGLLRMRNAIELEQNDIGLSLQNLYSKFKERCNDVTDTKIDFYRYGFGTQTDDFLVWAYRNGELITILWKLETEVENIKYADLKNYNRKIHEFTMRFSDFSGYVELLNQIFSPRPFGF